VEHRAGVQVFRVRVPRPLDHRRRSGDMRRRSQRRLERV
jgi:hypothetical protein